MTFQRLFAVEFRSELRDGRLRGHASVFNALAPIGAGYERIAPGAFTAALERGDDVRLLLNHNPDNLLARTSNGTLRLAEDDKGLAVDADLAETSLGTDVRKLIERGDLSGMSFGYRPDITTDTRSLAPDGRQIVTRNSVALLADVSLATFPAYADASDVQLRSIDFRNVRSNQERLTRARLARLTQKGH